MPNVKKSMMAAAGAGGGGSEVYMWGSNSLGQLGDPDGDGAVNSDVNWQVKTLGGHTWSDLVMGVNTGFGVTTDGELYAWGHAGPNQIPDGASDTNYRDGPVQIGTDTDWAKLSIIADTSYSCTRTDGTMWVWGKNNYGSLGVGDDSGAHGVSADRISPTQLGSLTDWGNSFTMLLGKRTHHIKSNGTLWSSGWQYNHGNLGNSSLTDVSSPIQVGTLTDWAQIGGHQSVTHGIKTDGTMWGWGTNNAYNAPIGNSTTSPTFSSPVVLAAPAGGGTWTSVAHQGYQVCAVSSDNKLYTWGDYKTNVYGPLPDTNVVYSCPVQVGTLTDWARVISLVGAGDGWALKTDGTLWAWGKNTNGTVSADGTEAHNTTFLSPIQIGTNTNWTDPLIKGQANGIAMVV